jgi:hypothetical protein
MYSEENKEFTKGPQFKDAAQELAAQIFPDVENSDDEVISHQAERERLVPPATRVLCELARVGLIDIDDVTNHQAGNR